MAQHATSLDYLSRANTRLCHTGYCVWWLFQPPCHCQLHSCICCEPSQKIRKGQQYLFLFNNFLNKILKHLTCIWYYTTGSLTITRHDKLYSWVLEYMYYMPKLSNHPTLIGLPHLTCWASVWTCWASFCIGFTLVLAIFSISLV